MKIGIECQRIYRTAKHGMDVVAMELLHQLRRSGTVNQYQVFARSGPDEASLVTAPHFQKTTLSALSYADWEQVVLPVAAARARLDLLHCTGNTAPVICPVPLVLTLHDIIYLEENSFGGSTYQDLGNVYRRMVVPQAIRHAKAIITVSAFEKEVIASHCAVDPAKIKVIYNGVSPRFSELPGEAAKKSFRKKYNLPQDYLLCFGNTAPKKNTAGLIAAYIHYCETSAGPLPLVIADYDREWVLRQLKQDRQQKWAANIFCPGYIPAAETPLLYRCSALFVYPSLRESFGLPLLEAMASEVPVITSNLSAIPEIAGGAAMLVDPRQPVSIAAAIGQLAGNGTMREAMISKGLVRAAQFSWARTARQVLEVYNEVAGAR